MTEQETKPLERWQCGDCGDIHDFEDDARECCAPEIYEVWLCPECNKDYDEETTAAGCCPDDPDSVAQRAHESLERIGQARLPL